MRKGIGFIREVDEAWVPSAVFGSDTRSAGCANGQVKSFASGGGTVGAVACVVLSRKVDCDVCWRAAKLKITLKLAVAPSPLNTLLKISDI